MQPPQILTQHEWLSQFVGEWEAGPAPGSVNPPECPPTRETARMIGGIWLLIEGRGSLPGGLDHHYLTTLGFNPETGRFVGSWVGSMMTSHWQYDGELSADGTQLTLHCEGPTFEDPTVKTRYKDILTLHSPTHRSLRGVVLNREGEWQQFMESHHYRV